MAHRIEKQIRSGNPEVITGVDIKKVNDAIGTITHRVGQKGYTVKTIDVIICSYFSPKEASTLAYKLMSNHRLRIVTAKPEMGWRDDIDARACHTHSI